MVMRVVLNERGSVPVLPVVIAAALGVGLAASMFLNWAQYQKYQDEARQMKGTIADLKYQVIQDQQGATPKPSPSASATPTPSASPSPSPGTVAGAQTLTITEMGVKLTPSAPLADLGYKPVASQTKNAVVVGFTSPSLTAKYPKCVEFGQLVKRPASQVPPKGNIYIKSIGGYKFYFYNPDGSCDTSPQAQADIAAADNALLDVILKTLTQ